MQKTQSPSIYFSRSQESNQTEQCKSPKIQISQLHRKFYPLNFTLTSSSFEVPSSSKKKYEKTPEFMNEFVSFSPKGTFNPTCKIDSRNTWTFGFGYNKDQEDDSERDLHPPISVYIPPVSYRDIKLNRPQSKSLTKKEEIFHPNVVYFSQRSKMVFYSREPMKYLPKPNKKLKLVKAPVRQEFSKIKTNKDYQSSVKPTNFDDKLKRLREIIKDPLI